MAAEAARIILVVEDDLSIRMHAIDALEEAGWAVIAFETADQAAAFWSSPHDTVAAVFTDINMPGELDGLDLALLVTRTLPRAVVVVTSARYTQAPGDLAGKIKFLPKPWARAALIAALEDGGEPRPSVLPEPQNA